MNLGRGTSTLISAAVFLVVGALQPVRGDDVSEADSTSQSRTSHQSAGKQTEAKVIEQPSAKTTEPWIITVGAPGWLAGMSGVMGFKGAIANMSVDVAQILRNINVIYSFGGEFQRGRYGALGDLLYLGTQGSQATPGLVSKLDLGLQYFLGEFFLSYRVIEGPHGWLDLLGGFRYTYVGSQLGLQANNMEIGAASTQLVDDFAQQLVTPGSQVRTIVEQNITDKLTALEGHNPKLPAPPLAGALPGQIRNSVEALLASSQAELLRAIQTGDQARVNQLKAQISGQIANRLTNQLNRSFSFYDDWFDPVIGLRARFNLNKAFYLTAESDVGGFGIGSDVAVQVYRALGCQITRYIRAEAGYRYYYDDFRDEGADGFLYQVALHGAQISVGLTF
jgi:hypothetical protein